jgi:hypothetical protein
MDKQYRRNVYHEMYKDIFAELEEKRKAGKEKLAEKGITFSVFKGVCLDLLVFGDGKVDWYARWFEFCEFVGDGGNDDVVSFANIYFEEHTMERHGIRLKSKPDDRL